MKFKEKTNPKAKDELETTLVKLPGELVCLAIDEKNARLITYVQNGENFSLHFIDNFQPLLEHREKLRKEFDSTRSEIIAGLFGDRLTGFSMPVADMVVGYTLKPRP